MLALLIAATSFAGGNTNDLVHALREATNQDVVIVRGQPADKALEALEFDPSSTDAMNNVFRPKYDLRVIPGSMPLFSDDRIPSSMLSGIQAGTQPVLGRPDFIGQNNGNPGGRKAFSSDAIQNGKITFRTEKSEFLDMNSLLNGPLAKPVTMSWVYQDAMPYVEFKGATPSAFLEKVAKGVGARFRETDKAYALELQPEEFRHRALHSLNSIKQGDTPQSKLTYAKAQLAASTLNALSSQQITQCWANPSSSVTVAIARNGSLLTAVNGYVVALENAPQFMQQQQQDVAVAQEGGPQTRRQGRGQARQPNVNRQISMALRMADPRRSATVTMSANFHVEVEVPIAAPNGNPAGSVRF